MPSKRTLSQRSPAASPARKLPRLLTVDAPASPPRGPYAPGPVSPSDTEHVPSPPLSASPLPLPSGSSYDSLSRSTSLGGLNSDQLAARLQEMTERYDRAVDDVEAEIVKLKRQISLASRLVESSPSFEQFPSPSLHHLHSSFRSSEGDVDGLGCRLDEATDRYERTMENAGAEVYKLQCQLHAASHRLSAAASVELPAGQSATQTVSAVRVTSPDYSLDEEV